MLSIKTFTFFIFLFISSFALADLPPGGASLFFEHTEYKNTEVNSTGIKYFLGNEKLSLVYCFSMGKTSQNNLYGHIPFGVVIAALIADKIDDKKPDSTESLKLFLLLCALLPEGIEYHFEIFKYFSISPYVHWLGGEINVKNQEELLINYGLGINFNFLFTENISLSPYIGVKGIYKTGEFAYSLGASFDIKW